MAKALAVLVGIVTTALLFPFGGTGQCTDTPAGGECIEWSDSILVRYMGENGAVGMLMALVAGIATALVVYFLVRRLIRQRRASSRES
jgi:hypothetical protein